MADQTVQIGVRTGTSGDFQSGADLTQSSPQEADAQAAARFGEALAQAPKTLPTAASGGRLVSPFELLGGASQASKLEASVGCAPQSALVSLLQDSVSALLVGEGQEGRREVRITLDESLMPGVSVALYEDAGAWVADVCCSDAASYDTLARAASDLARQMSQALARDALWRVTLDSGLSVEPMTVEAFSSCP